MSYRRARARALLLLTIASLLAVSCRAEFDIERDVAAAGNEDLVVERSSDTPSLGAENSGDTDGIDELDDDEDDVTFGFDLDEDEDGSFSFDFSTDDVEGVEGFIPTGPASDPDRDMSWNNDPGSVLEHLASIAPADSGLAFEWKTVAISDDESVTGPFPIGWEISEPFLGITLDPGDDFDFFTDAELDAGCQGSCEPQDWGALMDDLELSPFRRDIGDVPLVLQDLDPIVSGAPEGRMLVTLASDTTFAPGEITVIRWSDEASHFLWCSVSLDEGDVDLWPVMADMCAAMRPDWMG